jgi:predicted nucleic acid-binding protein
VRGVLVDTGPLVAIIDADDAFHDSCVQNLKKIRDPLFTVWPVISEAMHLVGSVVAQERLWDVLEDAPVRLLALEAADIPAVRALMRKYADLPMDLADAALVHVAARERLQTVFTIDRADFGIYRLPGGRRLRLLP